MDPVMRVFVAVAEKENFTRAAEFLHMTQPAVSQYIQSLERAVGTKLLERSNKYVRLNKAGEIVYHHAKEILGLYDRMQYLVDDLRHSASGDISIGASYTYGEYVLPHIISEVMKQYPGVKPTITIGNTQEIEERVAGKQLDIGVVEGGMKHDKLRMEPIASDRMSIIVGVGHRLAKDEKTNLADLHGETWIVREPGSGTREATDKMFAIHGITPDKTMEFGSTQIIKESVEAGLGISLLSHWAIRKELSLGTLKVLSIDGFPFTRTFSLITSSTPFYTKTMEVFMEMLRRDDALPS
ncbi:LysR family transcriptional regulator [Paenibacillus puldeungensis]|uniref:LysR family transcriptional regulator n=1 Tax=Paenibacillus puldeungensis TaxID=696536 RepID=A0ABW3S0V6_9BACL